MALYAFLVLLKIFFFFLCMFDSPATEVFFTSKPLGPNCFRKKENRSRKITLLAEISLKPIPNRCHTNLPYRSYLCFFLLSLGSISFQLQNKLEDREAFSGIFQTYFGYASCSSPTWQRNNHYGNVTSDISQSQ